MSQLNDMDKKIRPVYELIQRMTPSYEEQFYLEIINKQEGQDVFEISSGNGKVHLKGNNGVSLASAFHWYLKYVCHVHFSWNGKQLNLPKQLPLPDKPVKINIEAQHRAYFNYCTFNYSASWWDWERWEWEIDYMAMNGINMPLSVVGLEGVWYHTLLKFGFNDLEARSFLVGPTHFAWQWMTNIQSYGGPLPKSWIDSHIELGKKIINKQLELGMRPIQQGFSGYVPRELKDKFDDVNISYEKEWCGFKGTAQMDPLDPMFKGFGKVFLETQKELFGAHGVYAADPFHEGEPPKEGKEYLNKVGEAIFDLMNDFDSSMLWAMQSWSIQEDIVAVIPKDRLLILALNGDVKGEDFWEYDFVVGNLHNFGGRINMHGDLPLLSSNQYQKAKEKYPNAKGSGLFMEAIGQNPLYYDLAFEMVFHKKSVELTPWLEEYTFRRYGKLSKKANEAIELLLEHPYREGTNGVENSSIICARPAVDVKKSGPNAGFDIPYEPRGLIKALSLLIEDSNDLASSDAYRFDIVDIKRQVLSNLGQVIHKQAALAFKAKELAGFDRHSQRFISLLKDADTVLKTRLDFSFDKWISDARSWGKTEEEKKLYEKNASMLVTQWGGDGDAVIFDYSWREWSGLISGYYLPRWQKFYTMLREHLVKGTKYIEEGLPLVHEREALRANDFYNELANWEMDWIVSIKEINPTTKGDEVEVVRATLKKYNSLFDDYYK